jgi:hypothetical protein
MKFAAGRDGDGDFNTVTVLGVDTVLMPPVFMVVKVTV